MEGAPICDAPVFPDNPHLAVYCNGDIYVISTGKKLTHSVYKGYSFVVTHVAGKVARYSVAYMVCRTYHGPRPYPAATVDHMNRVKSDNDSTNLRWASKSMQAMNRAPSSHYAKRSLRDRKIHKLDSQTGEIVATYDSVRAAAESVIESREFKPMRSAIMNITQTLMEHRKTARGFGWSFTEAVNVESQEGEEWRPVPGTICGLQVSSHGRLKRKKTHTVTDGEDLVYCPIKRPLFVDNDGYTQIGFTRASDGNAKGVFTSTSVHRLVATAFLGQRPTGWVVTHLDGNLRNDRLENLAYAPPAPFGSKKRNRNDFIVADSDKAQRIE